MGVQDRIEELLVRPGRPADLAQRDTRSTRTLWLDGDGQRGARQVAGEFLRRTREELARAQELFYAVGSHAMLVILQAPDAAGKDGTIKHVMSGVNPQGCSVVSFGRPSTRELQHDFLWRCARALPERGKITIFNRSYYEDVLVPRVHPEILGSSGLSGGDPEEEFWAGRYKDINSFERHLDREGTRIVKLFLHVSKREQRRRLLARLDDPCKHWKFDAADLTERAFFDAYQHAYERAITATSTPWAPWYVVPADRKYALRALVSGILLRVINRLDLRLPPASDERRAEIEAARQALLSE